MVWSVPLRTYVLLWEWRLQFGQNKSPVLPLYIQYIDCNCHHLFETLSMDSTVKYNYEIKANTSGNTNRFIRNESLQKRHQITNIEVSVCPELTITEIKRIYKTFEWLVGEHYSDITQTQLLSFYIRTEFYGDLYVNRLSSDIIDSEMKCIPYLVLKLLSIHSVYFSFRQRVRHILCRLSLNVRQTIDLMLNTLMLFDLNSESFRIITLN